MKKTIRDYDLNNKKVLIRVDFNVPMKDGKITDDTRVKASLPTIKYALDNDAKVILLSHLGRVKEESDKKKLSLKPVFELLSSLLEEKVYFLGMRNDVNELMQIMDCFVFPSLYEGLGMVLIEAQTCNLPCIASTQVPIEARINQNVVFFELKRKAKDWANEILRLINQVRIPIDKTNNVNYLSNYNIEAEANKLLEIYMKLYET